MIPPTLLANNTLSRWVGFETPGRARIAVGKVEYGQGALTGLVQIAAEELDVGMDQLEVVNAATGRSPDEGMTVGSMSTEMSGPAIRAACAEVRAQFLAEAARRLGRPADAFDIAGGVFLVDGEDSGESYWTLAAAVDLNRPATGEVRWKTPDRHRLVGTSVPRVDMPAKVFAGGFLHDRVWPDVLHARVLRQPGAKATLAGLDEAAIRRAAGDADLDILVDGAFIAFLSSSERAASAALAAAEATVRWNEPRALAPGADTADHLKTLPEHVFDMGAPVGEPANRRRLQGAYSRPYISHGSIGPSCGVARYEGGRMKVWTHAQGVYPQQAYVARVTGLAPDLIDVEHAQGAGCYGHNGSDDAAVDAAVIAQRRPGKTIRVQWRREDEFGFSPVGAAMRVEMTAELDAAGRLADWTTEIWSGPHVGRGRTLAEQALPRDPDAAPPAGPDLALLQRFSGGRLNALPSYDIPAARVTEHLVMAPPLRTSSLRGLGGPVNIYAVECFVDELAEAAGADPVDFRLAMTSDPRATAVIEKCAELSGWRDRGPVGMGRGLGFSFDRHRDRGAYCAVAALISVDAEVKLEKLWCVADIGLVINPDGAKNQLEGGMIMSASWTLKEQVRTGAGGISSLTWDDYPILRFDEIPEVVVELINHPETPAMGAGEISSGGVMAAIGNAVAHALGARLRHLPFTRERIAEALLSGDT